jgi:transposase
MAKRRQRRGDGRKAERWRQVIEGHRRSGLSIRAYCRRRGVSEPSFYFWRRELGSRVQAKRTRSACFAPVRVVTPMPQGLIEVVLPDDITVRVSAGADETTLAAVMQALRRGPDTPC